MELGCVVCVCAHVCVLSYKDYIPQPWIQYFNSRDEVEENSKNVCRDLFLS